MNTLTFKQTQKHKISILQLYSSSSSAKPKANTQQREHVTAAAGTARSTNMSETNPTPCSQLWAQGGRFKACIYVFKCFIWFSFSRESAMQLWLMSPHGCLVHVNIKIWMNLKGLVCLNEKHLKHTHAYLKHKSRARFKSQVHIHCTRIQLHHCNS